MSELTVGSLFAGIGGFDLGFERAGMRVVWQCEQDEFCRAVLAERFPGVPCYPDVRALVADTAGTGREARRPDGVRDGSAPGQGSATRSAGEDGVPVPVPYVDVLCGGFPCQDLSVAGKGAGIRGSRSGLWREFARLVGELRPRYAVIENVAALTSRGLDVVLGDLAACGFDAEWDCLPASAFGARHRRDRLWVVAYPNGERGNGARALHEGWQESANGGGGAVGDTHVTGLEGRGGHDQRAGERAVGPAGWWLTEPDVGRVANGVPNRVDRLAALGNALVPQIAQWLGERIIAWEEGSQ